MHEMSLCESIVQTLEEQAIAQNYNRVKRVWLVVGPLACIEPEALQFSFSVVCKGTLAEGAELLIEEEQVDAWCMQCCKSIKVESREAAGCPSCHSYQLQVNGGDALRIKELEVE